MSLMSDFLLRSTNLSMNPYIHYEIVDKIRLLPKMKAW